VEERSFTAFRTGLDRLLKNSVHPSTDLRANGISLEITSKYPFMRSQVEACKLFFNSLLNFERSYFFRSTAAHPSVDGVA
jgi:hypothetical protein